MGYWINFQHLVTSVIRSKPVDYYRKNLIMEHIIW